ncbi:Phosphotyrosyl phosphatase activator [Multifurca ochricompacta]|uniref:Serine/threonine-protein phosphatase 2A activator n=1 Tax=Multifurca ochricompacta TaxID=376703 RepID=A0AAD4LY19_9AGAM|nr:Phosphotyrosyl phosphatase activator [Multifurca ochricompacta]
MASIPVPPLRHISLESLIALQTQPPTSKIRTDADVEVWKQTQGYSDYSHFLRWLNEAVVGCAMSWTNDNRSEGIRGVLDLLDQLDRWIDEIPPLPTAQRFGNLAFRTWGKRLEDRADELLKAMMPNLSAAVPYVRPYLLTSFGSFVRMDYGTGHETSFAIFLLCLTLLRFLRFGPEEAKDIVLIVFVRYLRLCWRLQDVYRLEPAGSHGVWGLDDTHFLGYIFGSAQLRDQSEIPVSAILHPPLPPTNLYFMSIMRIHEVKHGPFHEHSSQLYSIATGVATWKKVNSGLFKMYEAEVLGKRVVVQHLPLGGILEWNDISAPPITTSVSPPHNNILTSTPAPWVSGTAVNAASNDTLMTTAPSSWSSPSASIGREGAIRNLPSP